MPILIVAYLALGYWATGKTILANKVLIAPSWTDIFMERIMWGAILGGKVSPQTPFYF